MMQVIFFVFWFFLSAGVANMAPVFAAKISYLQKYSYPIDFYKTYKGKRIFGDHKTIRGFICGIVLGLITVSIQYAINPAFFNSLPANPLFLGLLLSFGALTGDAIKSFFKRQKGTEPGKMWIPFDQIDYILGAIVFSSLYVQLSWYNYFFSVVLFFLLHMIFTYSGYLLKLKDDPI